MLTPVTAAVEFFVVVSVALAAVLLGAIGGRGFLASAVVGFSIIYGGGLQWFLVVAVFFILGVVSTWYRYGYKKKLGAAQEKGGARSWPNILANGGVASFVAVFNFFNPTNPLSALFLGAISTAAADTAATELGLLSNKQPRLITDLKKEVRPGTSGGVSALGFAGATLASLIIGLMALFVGVAPGQVLVVPVCVFGGISGAVADSVLGATVQRQGFCPICLKPTEAIRHCGETTRATGGIGYIENNVVNLIATTVGAASSLAAFLALSQIA